MSSFAARMALSAIALYRCTLSPLLGQRCRFHPSCSRYAADAITRHGAWRGGLLAFFRICRCQPLCSGGLDPVPERWNGRPWRRNPESPPSLLEP